ncbi:MAG: hypothetical protein PHU21_10355 [Elusimicrobia bacterium]|nr:hypothetical protein [Elusimicrobiota bacterium]
MSRMLLAAALLFCGGPCFAESMNHKLGLGLRSDSADVRYFVTDWLAAHAGASFWYDAADRGQGADNSTYSVMFGAFYNKELPSLKDGVFVQAGLTNTYFWGKVSGEQWHEWDINPFVGGEFVYKGRFGVDFKVIPFQYVRYVTRGNCTRGWGGMAGSMGAHIYFGGA